VFNVVDIRHEDEVLMLLRSAAGSKPILFFVFALFFVAQLAQGSPDTTIRVDPQYVSAQVNEVFSVSITVSSVQRLYGLDVILSWDPAILEAVNSTSLLGVESHTDGILHEAILPLRNNVSQDKGIYNIAGVSIGPAPVFNGDGKAATITFRVKTTLASYPDPISETIFYTAIDGHFGESSPPREFDWHTLTIPVIAVVVMVVSLSLIYILVKKNRQRKDMPVKTMTIRPSYILL
jgi:hypothetical protein